MRCRFRLWHPDKYRWDSVAEVHLRIPNACCPCICRYSDIPFFYIFSASVVAAVKASSGWKEMIAYRCYLPGKHHHTFVGLGRLIVTF